VQSLAYSPLERLQISQPVDRVSWIAERCRARAVLDLGCFDETALAKQTTPHWLHGQIASTAASVLGVDSSAQIPAHGLETGPRSRIIRGDISRLDDCVPAGTEVDVIVAGELIEHLPDTLGLLRQLKRR
jgi:trans-aconitate methyltransferase